MLHRTHVVRITLRAGRRRLFAAAFAGVLAVAAGAPGPLGGGTAAAQGFLSVIEDVPLAPGLTEAPAEAVMFDSPAGRIVEATAEGRIGREAVVRFYNETLPQLGWQPAGPAFRREGEELSLEINQPAGLLTVRFRLRPVEPPRP